VVPPYEKEAHKGVYLVKESLFIAVEERKVADLTINIEIHKKMQK
jgi:hypothetical protein